MSVAKKPSKEKYGTLWPVELDELAIEMKAIELGGRWRMRGTKTICGAQAICGKGLAFHYEEMRKILWPTLYSHRWHKLCLAEIRRPGSQCTVLMGPGSSGKTHEAAWNYLCEYFVRPKDTCVLVSSTDIRGLRKRIWGEISKLWQEAKDRFDWLPGHYLDHSLSIATDELDDCDIGERRVRDMRCGIFGVPCVNSQNTYVGLGKFQGIKQKHMRLVADEAALMDSSFLKAIANMAQNEDFQCIIIGNPSDPYDPLGRAAEPVEGWQAYNDIIKTTVWNTKFMSGRCVNLIGIDSPNFDPPAEKKVRYPCLIKAASIELVKKTFGEQSFEYESQCIGRMRVGTLGRRVITHEICEQGHVSDTEIIWGPGQKWLIYGLDSAYGGDRCVGGYIEFGTDIMGKQMILAHKPRIIPVSEKNKSPEQVISAAVMEDCMGEGISPSNMFHDSTGRGMLGTELARMWSDQTNPVEFGGSATDRPVSADIYIFDDKLEKRRLMKCNERYANFVTELWFAVRIAIEADQIRGLPDEVIDEGCMREWNPMPNGRRRLERKEEMKQRVGRSPDFFDWFAICVEGARRRGFMVQKLADPGVTESGYRWLWRAAKAATDLANKGIFSR